MLLFFCCTLASCESDPKHQDVIGTYVGSLFGVQETITLREDGSFEQKLLMPTGKRLILTNKWSLHHKLVELKSYLHFYGTGLPKRLQMPPLEVDLMTYAFERNALGRVFKLI